MAGSESFTKSVLGVMKWPSSLSVSQITARWKSHISKQPALQDLDKIDCFLIDDRENHGRLWINMNASKVPMSRDMYRTHRESYNFISNEKIEWNYKISTVQRRYFLRPCSAVLSSFHSRGMNDCHAMTKPDLFPKQSGHFGQEFDMSDNPIALSQQSFYSWDLSHGHLGLCY